MTTGWLIVNIVLIGVVAAIVTIPALLIPNILHRQTLLENREAKPERRETQPQRAQRSPAQRQDASTRQTASTHGRSTGQPRQVARPPRNPSEAAPGVTSTDIRLARPRCAPYGAARGARARHARPQRACAPRTPVARVRMHSFHAQHTRACQATTQQLPKHGQRADNTPYHQRAFDAHTA